MIATGSAPYVNGWGKLQVELALEIFFKLRHCLLLVLRRSSLFFAAARHNDRAGGDRAAGVSDVLFYALRPTFIPAAASVTGAVCQWHHDDSIIFLMCRFLYHSLD